MVNLRKLTLFFILFITAKPILSQDFVLINGDKLNQLKHHDYLLDEELARLYDQADAALKMNPPSVTDKEVSPSSGDKQDYMSQGPYWWPDPEKADGLPYIRRDGEKNPEIERLPDKKNLHELINAVDKLGLSYFYSDKEEYASKVTQLIEVWFLDSATRMNPNLNFGQAIPGRTEGRGIGIIETRQLAYLLDGVRLISRSEAWTKRHQSQFNLWVSEYLDWLVNSQHGKDEAVNGNNHTTWYFVQSIAMAVFTKQDSLARALQKRGVRLIVDNQITADGKQPEELARTRSWDYSTMNMLAVYYFAILSEKLDLPIWEYQDKKIKVALDFLLPYLSDGHDWKYQQITKLNRSRLWPTLKIAANHYPDAIFNTVYQQQYDSSEDQLFLNLRFP